MDISKVIVVALIPELSTFFGDKKYRNVRVTYKVFRKHTGQPHKI